MEKQLQEFNRLTDAAEYLRSVHGFSTWTIGHYKWGWRIVREYMVARGIKDYRPSVGKKILSTRFNNQVFATYPVPKGKSTTALFDCPSFRLMVKLICILMERRQFHFNGKLGKAISTFISHKTVNERLSLVRIWGYQRHLHAFLKYCKSQRVHSLSKVDLAFVLKFIRHLNSWKGHPVYQMISMLRSFIKYAHGKKLLKVDFSERIPKYRSVSQPKLPSTYSKEEIIRLINSIDRFKKQMHIVCILVNYQN